MKNLNGCPLLVLVRRVVPYKPKRPVGRPPGGHLGAPLKGPLGGPVNGPLGGPLNGPVDGSLAPVPDFESAIPLSQVGYPPATLGPQKGKEPSLSLFIYFLVIKTQIEYL